MTAEHVERLRDRSERERTLLWLRGTGVNAWSYFGFLQRFSLEELAQFESIVGVSGGAAVFWVSVLSRCGHFDLAIIDHYDDIVRSVMNRAGVPARLSRIALMRSPYLASEHLDLLASLVSEEAAGWTFSQFPLRNFRVLTATPRGYREFGLEGDGTLPVAPIIAIGGTPSTGQDLRLGGVAGEHADFEYAKARVKRQYRHDLSVRYPSARKLVLNTRFVSDNANREFSYLRLSPDRWPRFMFLVDALLLMLNVPNRRYRKAFRWSLGEPR